MVATRVTITGLFRFTTKNSVAKRAQIRIAWSTIGANISNDPHGIDNVFYHYYNAFRVRGVGMVNGSSGLVVETSKRLLTASEFQNLANVPPEVEWFANIETRTRGEHTRTTFRVHAVRRHSPSGTCPTFAV